jgi:hypothetical protein
MTTATINNRPQRKKWMGRRAFQADRGLLYGKARQILHLLQAANGGFVTYRLINYHLWERHGEVAPYRYNSYFTAIRQVTGLGVMQYSGLGCRLEPALDIQGKEKFAWWSNKSAL